MKQVLLAVIIVACFSSAVLARLIRVYVAVNMDNAPIEILGFGRSREEDEDHIFSIVEYQNITDRQIEAFAITIIYYDAFNEKQAGVRGIDDDLQPGQIWRGGWSIYGEPRFAKTAIAYVSAVRFLDGEIWKADTEKVFETAGDMPELSFLSETKMLEIEKE